MTTSIYLTGEAKAPSNNPIMTQYGLFYIAFEIEAETHRVLDVDCSATLALTRKFIRGLFIDADIRDTGRLTDSITARYHGSSQKALIVAVNSAAKKYHELPTSS
ncbi:DUF3870 domain-containing protein [Brevibacterium aurantiacum]|uniref:DUF3870 domain-containing protein n=1 Tax=Brevibacterium aurantiacum TaxID=273384 RepID=A0A3Q9NTG3_BREAU|nr:DUF3870 domain-containing protein [Brevibacterium aurantiacum]AZT94701.1 hypothetical protein CXR23_17390 [Brevibacterium aurantiacum]